MSLRKGPRPRGETAPSAAHQEVDPKKPSTSPMMSERLMPAIAKSSLPRRLKEEGRRWKASADTVRVLEAVELGELVFCDVFGWLVEEDASSSQADEARDELAR